MQRGEVDGIPVFWTGAYAGPARAGIRFRVGSADEPIAVRGVTHLIEHLALYRFGQPPFTYNGSVGQAQTEFTIEGRPDEVRQYLRDLTLELADLPYDQLETENRVLDVEAEGRGAGSRAMFHQMRFGANSYGRSIKLEIGRPLLEPDAIERWRKDWFTRGNAVIWMTGEPSETLGLELPEGPRAAPPPIDPLPGVQFPAYRLRTEDEVAIALLGPDEDAFRTALYVARRRLIDCLRRERGVIYEIDTDHQVLGYGRVHAALVLDSPDEHAALAVERLMRTLRELADDGPTDDELEFERDLVHRSLEDPETPYDEIHGAAWDDLMGIPARTMDDWRRKMDELTPADCARALADALPTALLDIPAAAEEGVPDGFAEYERTPPQLPKPDGPSFREKEETDCPQRPCEYTAGPEHLHLQPGDGSDPASIPYADIVGVVGAAGAAERILTADERRYEISRFKFPDADGLFDLLRRHVPGELFLPQKPAMRAVDEAAVRDVPKPELVTEELQDLAFNLREGERPLAMATDSRASDDSKPALIVVTSQRLFFIYDDPDGDDSRDVWNETERDEISEPAADADDEGVPRLSFTIDGERFHIDGLDSPDAAERLAQTLAAGDRTAEPA